LQDFGKLVEVNHCGNKLDVNNAYK